MDDLTEGKLPRGLKGAIFALVFAAMLAIVGVLARVYGESNVTVACSEAGRAQASQGGVVSMVTETLLWSWYCEKKRAAEKIEAEKVARRSGAKMEAPEPSVSAPAAPLPVTQAESAKPAPAAIPVPQTPTAPESQVAVATPSPTFPSAQARIACGDRRIPDAPQLASTWDQQICALIACGGGAEAIPDDLELVREWGTLAGVYAGKACMTAARQTLASQELVNSLYAAVDKSALPERDPSRTVCRRIRIVLGDSIKARQEKLAKVSTSGCVPGDATTVPADLRAFTDARGVVVMIPN